MLEKPRKCGAGLGGAPHDCRLRRNHGPGRVATKPPSNSMGLSSRGGGGPLMIRLSLKSPIPSYSSFVLKLKGKPGIPVPPPVLLEGRATSSSNPSSATDPTAWPPES